jgi:hypothetical protein
MQKSDRLLSRLGVLLLVLFLYSSRSSAQAFQGYTLYSPSASPARTYLINMSNTAVKTWSHSVGGAYSCYLLPDGTLLRSATYGSSLNGGGATGMVQKVSWSGTVTWQYTYSTTSYRSHHDIEPLPNGNVLLIAWEVKTAAQGVAAGLNHSGSIWPDHIIEVQPVGSTGGNIVWQWHAWDHLIQDYDATKANYGVVGSHPELLDINYRSTASGDWMHLNGISYNATLDQIAFSSHNLDEVYVIDHSTTTAQAATHSGGRWGKGGDFLYRWGNPAAYRAPGTQVFDVVHCAWWVPDSLPGGGHLMAFNNRESQSTSMVVELVPPVDSLGNYVWTPGTAYGPSSPIWNYTASGFYSQHLGGVQRLPNGNTLLAQSTSGKMLEVTSAGTVVWSYAPGGEIIRALRYAPTYSGLQQLFPASYSASRTSIAFGTVAVSGSRTDSIVIRNGGSGTLTISAIASSNATQFGTTETAPVAIAAGDSTRIHMIFHPTTGGLQTGRITFTHNGSSSPDTVHVEGTGLAAAFSSAPASVAFGGVQVSSTKIDSVVVKNPGGASLTISSIVSGLPAEFTVAESAPITLAAGDSTRLHITFHPALMGIRSTRITLSHNGITSPDTIHVEGTGLASVFSATPASLSFGNVRIATIRSESLLVQNAGNMPLHIATIATTNTPLFVVAESGPITLGAGEYAYLHTQFSPVTTGFQQARVTIVHDGTTSPDTIHLEGTGSNSVAVLIESGWNMISNPVNATNDSVRALYPTSLFPYGFAFVAGGGYVQSYRMTNGLGYWGKFASPTGVEIAGDFRESDSIEVAAGWNMVGTISGLVDTSAIVSIPAGIRASSWFGYSAGYSPATQLVPGKSYWIKASAPGTFILHSGSRKAAAGRPAEKFQRH